MGQEAVAASSAPPRRGRGAAAGAWLSDAAFWFFWLTFGTLVHLLFRVRVLGPRPPRGACVLVANHTSFLDPVLLGAVCNRRVRFLMTAALVRKPGLAWFYRWNRVIPVSLTGNNRDALRAARAALEAGHTLGVFPEGAISRDGRLGRGNPGAVALALTADVPIVPVGISGAGRALAPDQWRVRFVRITVRFGTPLSVAGLVGGDERGRKQRLQTATERLMAAIAVLCDADASGAGGRDAADSLAP